MYGVRTFYNASQGYCDGFLCHLLKAVIFEV